VPSFKEQCPTKVPSFLQFRRKIVPRSWRWSTETVQSISEVHDSARHSDDAAVHFHVIYLFYIARHRVGGFIFVSGCVARPRASHGSSGQTHQPVTTTAVESTCPLRQPVGRGKH